MREELAMYGGTPIRESVINYGHQYIDEDDIKAVINVLKSDLITCGPKVSEMEKFLCMKLGVKYAVAVSNGTAALHLACMAAGIKEGDEVITTPMTFVASANCVLYCGGKPVFADINPKTYNISPESIKEHITEKTKAVIVVDFTGQAVELDAIKKICKAHHLILIEDAAHAIGTKYKGKYIGNIADITTFSFHPVKTITSGEGGAITTNNKEIYEKIIRLRTHGITRDVNQIKSFSHGPWFNEQIELGYNYRMTDFQAALLVSQMEKLEIFGRRRSEIVRQYDEAFKEIPEVFVQEEIPESETTRHLYILRFKLDMLFATRLELFWALNEENIRPNVHYMPVYYHYYYQQLGYEKGLCPNAEALYEEILTLPLYYSLSDDDVRDVIAGVKKVINYYRK